MGRIAQQRHPAKAPSWQRVAIHLEVFVDVSGMANQVGEIEPAEIPFLEALEDPRIGDLAAPVCVPTGGQLPVDHAHDPAYPRTSATGGLVADRVGHPLLATEPHRGMRPTTQERLGLEHATPLDPTGDHRWPFGWVELGP